MAFYSNPGFWVTLGGAILSYTGLNFKKVTNPLRPYIIEAIKEGYSLKDWLIERYELSKEDAEDLIAEAKHEYEKELLLAEKAIEREKQLLDSIDTAIKKKTSKIKN